MVLEKAVRAIPDRILSVLIAENRLDSLAEVTADLAPETPVYAAGQAVMDAIVGFPIHRGILALGRRPERDPTELLSGLPDRALVVALSAIANHDNMGGIFRNAAAFGADAVVLDAACCDPLYRKAIRVSVGAALTVPFARLSPGEDLVGMLAAARLDVLSLSPRGEGALVDLSPPDRCAVLFGAEGPGLSEATLARTRTVRIAMAAGFDSLNVATTSGIVLHQLTARRSV